MTSEDKSVFDNIETLSNAPAKWTIFKFKMQKAFEARGWADHLEQSSDPDDEPLSTDGTTILAEKLRKREERKKQQAKSMAALIGKLDDTAIQMVMHLTTTHEVWNTLITANLNASQMGIASLRKDLLNLHYKPKSDLNAHLAMINRINLELMAAGINMSDLELITVLYKSMEGQVEYDGLIQSLSTAHALTPSGTPSVVTYQFVANQFHEKYRDLSKGKTITTSRNETALWGNDGEGSNRRDIKDLACRNCGIKGHFIKDCRKEGGGKAKKHNNSSNNGGGKNGGGNNRIHLALTAQTQEENLAVLSKKTTNENNEEVYLDLGASDHYFKNRK